VQENFTPVSSNEHKRTPDRLAAGLAFAFIVLLLATELVLTLPDEADSHPLLPGSMPSIGHSSLPCSC
jgi:hypothetical protein